MQETVLVTQIKELEQRVNFIFEERHFFALPDLINTMPVFKNINSMNIAELDDAFHRLFEYYSQVARGLKKDKLSSLTYQQSLGMTTVLVSLGVGQSNFNVHDIDKTSLHNLYKEAQQRIILLEQEVIQNSLQTRYSVLSNTSSTFDFCSQLLGALNSLLKEIQRLEEFKDTQTILPIPDVRIALYLEN